MLHRSNAECAVIESHAEQVSPVRHHLRRTEKPDSVTLSQHGLNADPAAVRSREAVRHSYTQSGAFAVLLDGEEGPVDPSLRKLYSKEREHGSDLGEESLT